MYFKNLSFLIGKFNAVNFLNRFTLFSLLLIVLGCGANVDLECNAVGEAISGCVPARNPNQFSRVYLWSLTALPNGDLGGGGIPGANAACVAGSGGAGLPSGTYTHQALISGSMQDARNIIDGASGPLRRPDNTLITNTWAGYFDQTVTLSNAVQTGAAVLYWSGLDGTGSPSTDNCSNWTVGLGTDDGTIGHLTRTNQSRLFQTNPTCGGTFRILCVSYGN